MQRDVVKDIGEKTALNLLEPRFGRFNQSDLAEALPAIDDDEPLVPLKLAKERASRQAAEKSVRLALQRSGGDKKRAAKLLGISRILTDVS